MDPIAPVNGHKTMQAYLLVFKQAAELGLSLILSGILIAVFLGWVDTPGSQRARDASLAAEHRIITHAEATQRFQSDLLEGLRKQRCMTAVANMATSSDAIASAALANDPCVYLEHLNRRGGSR